MSELPMTDPLTGLPNRPAIIGLVRQELQRRLTSPAALAVILVDVENFREINRRYLLPGGDEVLRQLAKLLVRTVGDCNIVGRIGAEEFLVLAPGTGFRQARMLAARIRSAVTASPFVYRGVAIRVAVHVGVAVAEAGVGADCDQLLQWAVAAME
jgi:diguanylate cyclase (GGDEF)-like protein